MLDWTDLDLWEVKLKEAFVFYLHFSVYEQRHESAEHMSIRPLFPRFRHISHPFSESWSFQLCSEMRNWTLEHIRELFTEVPETSIGPEVFYRRRGRPLVACKWSTVFLFCCFTFPTWQLCQCSDVCGPFWQWRHSRVCAFQQESQKSKVRWDLF